MAKQVPSLCRTLSEDESLMVRLGESPGEIFNDAWLEVLPETMQQRVATAMRLVMCSTFVTPSSRSRTSRGETLSSSHNDQCRQSDKAGIYWPCYYEAFIHIDLEAIQEYKIMDTADAHMLLTHQAFRDVEIKLDV